MATIDVTDKPADPAGLPEFMARELRQADWICRPGFLAEDRIVALRSEAEGLHAAGAFRAAGIGHHAERREDVRGDEILWLGDEVRAPEAERLFLDEFEGHYAVYPPGAAYARHLDRFREENRRVVSLVLYLNAAWLPEQGGALRLYTSPEVATPAAP